MYKGFVIPINNKVKIQVRLVQTCQHQHARYFTVMSNFHKFLNLERGFPLFFSSVNVTYQSIADYTKHVQWEVETYQPL